MLPPVYPRVCGVTLSLGLVAATTAGLSPRVRGHPYRVADRLCRCKGTDRIYGMSVDVLSL